MNVKCWYMFMCGLRYNINMITVSGILVLNFLEHIHIWMNVSVAKVQCCCVLPVNSCLCYRWMTNWRSSLTMQVTSLELPYSTSGLGRSLSCTQYVSCLKYMSWLSYTECVSCIVHHVHGLCHFYSVMTDDTCTLLCIVYSLSNAPIHYAVCRIHYLLRTVWRIRMMYSI